MSISRAIISALVQDSASNLPSVLSSGVTAELFTDNLDHMIFETIMTAHSFTGSFPDQFQIMDVLEKKKEWKEISSEFMQITNFDKHIRIRDWCLSLLETSRRRLQREAYMVYAHVGQDASDEEISMLNNRHKDLMNKADGLLIQDSGDMDEAFENVHKRIEDIINGVQLESKFSMRFLDGFDDTLGDIHDQELVVIAARPSVGKSAFVNNAIWNNIKEGRSGVLFNMEMSMEEIINQFASIESKVNLRRIKYHKNDALRLQSCAIKIEPMIRKHLTLYTVNDTIETMNGRMIKLFQQEEPPSFICVDYIQLIVPSNTTNNRSTQIAEITRTLKKWTQVYKCPVMALSQLNRGSESENRTPRMSDLRESGAIEQDANRVILLHRKTEDSMGNIQKEIDHQEIELIQDKNRAGTTGTMNLMFNRRITTYTVAANTN